MKKNIIILNNHNNNNNKKNSRSNNIFFTVIFRVRAGTVHTFHTEFTQQDVYHYKQGSILYISYNLATTAAIYCY